MADKRYGQSLSFSVFILALSVLFAPSNVLAGPTLMAFPSAAPECDDYDGSAPYRVGSACNSAGGDYSVNTPPLEDDGVTINTDFMVLAPGGGAGGTNATYEWSISENPNFVDEIEIKFYIGTDQADGFIDVNYWDDDAENWITGPRYFNDDFADGGFFSDDPGAQVVSEVYDDPNFIHQLLAEDRLEVQFQTGDSWWIDWVEVTVVSSAPEISVSPGELEFGNVELGESSTLEVTIENVGDGGPLTGSPELVGADSDEFTFDPPMSYALEPGETATYEVTYAPEEETSHSASLSIPHNGTNESSPVQVALSGEGLAASEPAIAVSPGQIIFQGVQVGHSSTTEVTVENVGDAGPLTGSPELVGADSEQFTFDPPADYALEPGQSFTYEVTYAPEEEGSHSASFSIPHNGANESSPVEVALSGQGLSAAEPAISVSPSQIIYGDVEIGDTVSSEVTIENTGGDGPLTGSPELVGSDSDEFVFEPEISYALDPGESVTYEVTYAPEEEGSHSASFSIPHNGTNESSPVEVALSGEGLGGVGPNPDFYLADNGVTVKCPDAEIGDMGLVGDSVYVKRNRAELDS